VTYVDKKCPTSIENSRIPRKIKDHTDDARELLGVFGRELIDGRVLQGSRIASTGSVSIEQVLICVAVVMPIRNLKPASILGTKQRRKILRQNRLS
jgi:hypothetical protein